MNEFEKQFPNLNEDIIVPFRNGKQFIDIETIQKHCLDKQKVKEAILRNGTHEGSDEIVEPICIRILKELGLEE